MRWRIGERGSPSVETAPSEWTALRLFVPLERANVWRFPGAAAKIPRHIAIKIRVDAIVVLMGFVFERTDDCEIDYIKAIPVLLVFWKFFLSRLIRATPVMEYLNIRRALCSRHMVARLARISQVARCEFARLLQNRRTSDG
jgi:hypothetical protein